MTLNTVDWLLEKAALSRGQEPKGVQESEEKKEAAERYMSEKQGGGQEKEEKE